MSSRKTTADTRRERWESPPGRWVPSEGNAMKVACSNCGHIFRRTDIQPGDIVRCNEAAPAVPVVEVQDGA